MYLRVGAIVVAVAACVLAWNQLRNGWKDQYIVLLDAPVQMSGATKHRIFTGLTIPYTVAVRFHVDGDDPRVLCSIGYRLGGYPEQIDKHLCARYPAVLYTRWLLREAQRVVANGQTEGKAQSFSMANNIVDAELGDFVSHAGQAQDLSVTFGRDERFLRFTHPRLMVKANWMTVDREFGVVWSEGAIVVAVIGVFLVVIGSIREAAQRIRRSRSSARKAG